MVFACTLFHCLKAKANNERKLKASEKYLTSNAGEVGVASSVFEMFSAVEMKTMRQSLGY